MDKRIKRQEDDERRALLNDDVKSGKEAQSRLSNLEWAQSSWTRFLHVLFWLWINPLLSLSHQRQLTENDLDDAPCVDKSLTLLDRLDSYDWSSNTTWMIVIKEFWKDYLFASLLFLPFATVCITQALLFRQLIITTTDKQGSNNLAYLYVALLFSTMIPYTLIERQAIFTAVRVAVRIRNALIITIYKRVLSLKLASWQQMDTGRIINLIANDTTQFEEFYAYVSSLCSGLLESIIIFGLLCWIIHPIPTLCAFASLSLFTVIQLYFNRQFTQYRKTTAIWTDQRIQAYSELIHGCHAMKMYNWEKPMGDHIVEMRKNELSSIRCTSRLRALNTTQYFISAPLLALITFGSAWLLGYPLNAANTFPVLLFFAFLRNDLMYSIPFVNEKFSQSRLASKRIDTFMRLRMTQQQHSSPLPTFPTDLQQQHKGSIIMSDASFSWHDDTPCLSSLDLTIEQGTFVGIVGPVGCGKSSLLVAILGEMNLIYGQINTNHSSFSYAAQSHWIFPDTLRNNILFNRPFNEQRYRKVIHACCLDVDLRLFGSSGDLTMVGEKGINLSGGQKARMSLARALYSDADIYLLDDPLASVDRTVAKQIYDRCIGPQGVLKNKTRVLVTHQTQFLHEAHQTIFLVDGQIDKQGCLNNIITREDDQKRSETSTLSDLLDEQTSTVDTQPIETDEISSNNGASWSVWYRLFTAPPSSRFGFCLLIVLLLLGEILNDCTSYYLSIWMKNSDADENISTKSACIYFGLIIMTVLADIIRTNYYFHVILNGTNDLHNQMLRGLLHTSIQFFESNPSGRILNRASKDQYVIDEVLPIVLLFGMISLLATAGSLLITCFINPSLFLVLIVLVPIGYLVIRYYQRSACQLKRLENITRSPIYAIFSTSLSGLTTIRAMKAEDSFIQLIASKIDINTSACINALGASQWFAMILNLISSLIFLFTSIQVVFFFNQMDSSTIALSLMSALSVSLSFQWGIRRLNEADILMTSSERIDEYSHLLPEEDLGGDKRLVQTSPNWPSHGTLEFRNYSLRHRSNLEYAIRNINLRIGPGQKIGILGRTGAGKSSLFKGILRFVDRSCVTGEILLDDVDISRLTLNHLRSHISVIPQQPVLFSGTLRYNLDPFNRYSDEQCWSALEDVQLKHFVNNHPAALSMTISESGNNLSAGHCQLICIARAILKKSQILLIDEATANIDNKTDDLIQAVINDKLQDRTVITIAHRLNTVAHCDRILVLDHGIIVNYDTSTNVLSSYP